MPISAALSRLISTRKAAPSLVWEEVAAVTRPFSRKQGFMDAIFSRVVSRRMPWSL